MVKNGRFFPFELYHEFLIFISSWESDSFIFNDKKLRRKKKSHLLDAITDKLPLY